MTKNIARIGAVRLRTAREVFGMWFFGDVAYAILPIITIATINLATGASFDRFLLAREWSFAPPSYSLASRYGIFSKSSRDSKESNLTGLDTARNFEFCWPSFKCCASRWST